MSGHFDPNAAGSCAPGVACYRMGAIGTNRMSVFRKAMARSTGRSLCDDDRHSATDSVEKLPTIQKNPENGSVSAEFCSFSCGYRTLVADFASIRLSRRVFQQNRPIPVIRERPLMGRQFNSCTARAATGAGLTSAMLPKPQEGRQAGRWNRRERRTTKTDNLAGVAKLNADEVQPTLNSWVQQPNHYLRSAVTR